ncbi:hypothetical protein T440DRAFT_169029 [Plenodomus tracheiphilus IPT5]|uniref:Transcription factor domain-containing protein n=1 Tax=Plenodomus tracheiphilus IPT5 TaxID=1408161 RepID=A0A6A7AZW5_9PLEO|nr:hypothetical protein T440DRAFT_169029 [Plenodomus tracheiphilus IPT5]
MTSLIDRGFAYFMHNYTIGVDQPPLQSEAYHKHLSTNGFNPLVATSMTAIGLAGVANFYMDSSLRREATRWYLRAIQMANRAISSPNEVKADTTLLTVNLLGMFEATSNENTLSGWSKHVDGAASLVKLRGMDQFSTPAGIRTYLHSIGLLTMNCMGKGEPLPEFVREMNDKVASRLDNSDPRNAFFFLHIKTINLRARILNQRTMHLSDIIDAARALDAIAVNIFKDKGSEWVYDEVSCGYYPRVFGNFYHVYPTAVTAQTWNWVRYNRIYFHDIIRNSILAGFATIPPTLVGKFYHEQLECSTRGLYKLQSDIMASMPQFLHDVPMVAPTTTDPTTYLGTKGFMQGYTKNHKSDVAPTQLNSSPETPSSFQNPLQSGQDSRPSPSAALPGVHKTLHKNFREDSTSIVEPLVDGGLVADRLPVVRISGGYSTVWALYVVCLVSIKFSRHSVIVQYSMGQLLVVSRVLILTRSCNEKAGSMPLASPASQDFVQTCLVRIEREFGIRQARVLAGALRLKVRLDKQGATAFGICPQYLPPDDEPYVSYQGTGSHGGKRSSEMLMGGASQAALPSFHYCNPHV